MIRIGVALVTATVAASCASIESESANAASRQVVNIPIVRPTTSDPAPAAEVMYQVMAGELAGQYGDLEGSVAHYIQAARLSDDPRVAARATTIALYAQDDDAALTAAKRWVELTPSNTQARQTLGLLLMRSVDLDAALPHLEFVVRHTPGATSNGFMLIGAALSQEKNSRAALEIMQRLVARHADKPLAHYALANLALSAGQDRQAVEAADKALAIKPVLTEAWVVRARALLALGKTQQAVATMRQAVEIVPDDHALRVAYAKMLVQVGRFDMARAEFSKLLKQNPDDPDLLYTLGLLDLQKQQYADANKHFHRLLKTEQRTNEARYYLGRVAETLTRLDEAINWYSQVDAGQYRVDAQARIASIYAKRGELEQGLAQLERARAAESEDSAIVQLYLAEGQILGEANRHQAAISLFGRALNKYPGDSDLLYARALMAEKIGRMDQLERDLRTILKKDPGNATALNALGYTLANHNKRIHEALGYIRRAYAKRPHDPAVIDSMGWVHFRLGNYDRAERYLRRAFKLLPNGEIAGHLSEIMWAQGEKKKARAVLKEALHKEPQDEYLLKLRARYAR
ncbi:MAG TPA: tetratricopeptide repeat protein [Gammaproteobacteria bacterium]|nr:tetratricopeptide repeat protein [Gammaproteobacteria bacterium]